jgi:hypothetical protein
LVEDARSGLFLLAARGERRLFPGLPDRLYALEHRTFLPLTAASATERPVILLSLGPLMNDLKRRGIFSGAAPGTALALRAEAEAPRGRV